MCGRLLVVSVCLLVICGLLWSFVVVYWWLAVVCDGLWSFLVVPCFSSYLSLLLAFALLEKRVI